MERARYLGAAQPAFDEEEEVEYILESESPRELPPRWNDGKTYVLPGESPRRLPPRRKDEKIFINQGFGSRNSSVPQGLPFPRGQAPPYGYPPPGSSSGHRPPPAGNSPQVTYIVGDKVQVWSSGHNTWLLGKVVRVDGDMVTAEYGAPDGLRVKERPANHTEFRLDNSGRQARKALGPQSRMGPYRGLKVHYSWPAHDVMDLVKYRDLIEQKLQGSWTNAKLIDPGVKSGWFEDWEDLLKESAAVVVVWSETYKAKVVQKGSPLNREAHSILQRKEQDPNFKVYVLNPKAPGQGYADLVLYLQANRPEINSKAWSDYVLLNEK